jgi:hypothetical protein
MINYFDLDINLSKQKFYSFDCWREINFDEDEKNLFELIKQMKEDTQNQQ